MKLVFKILFWLVGSIITLLLLVIFMIQIPTIQNIIRKQAITFVENKINTPVEIVSISIKLPKLVVLKGVYFEDQNGDTLLAGESLSVDISLLKLLKNQIEINKVDLQGITANVSRTMPDSVFNFDYILNAFVSADASPPDTTGGMTFSIKKINLDRIRVTFNDAVTANDVSIYIDHFDTRIKTFDLDNMKFSLPDIKLSGLNAVVVQSQPALKQESTAKVEADSNVPFDLELSLGTIDLSNIKIDYQSDISNLKTNLDLDQLQVDVNLIDMKRQRIDLKKVLLTNTRAEVVLGKSEQAKIVAEEVDKELVATANNDWRVSVGKFELSEIDLHFDDFSKPEQPLGMDYAHLGITGLNFQAAQFYYSPDTISGHVSETRFASKDGFILNTLQVNFIYSNTGVLLENMYIETPGTTLSEFLSVTYPSLEALSENPATMGVDATLVNCKVSFKNILSFMPEFAAIDPFKQNPNAIIAVSGKVSGMLDDLKVPDLKISGFENTRISAALAITGLPDMNKAVFDVVIHEFSSGSADLKQLLSPEIIPETIHLPEQFTIAGNFNGGISSFKTNLTLSSAYGAANIIAELDNIDQAGKESFNATIVLDDFNAGHLLNQEETMGKIEGEAQVTGTGFDTKTMEATFSANIRSAELMGYTFTNMLIEGEMVNQEFLMEAKMIDPNLQFNLNATAKLQNTFPAVSFTIVVDNLNLKELGLYETGLSLRAKIAGELPSTNPDSLVGTIHASNLLVTVKEKPFKLDSINITATAEGSQRELHIQSEVLTANLIGQYRLTEIGKLISNEINQYFKMGDGTILTVTHAQNFTFAMNVINQPIIQEFVPQLTQLEPVEITGSFNSEAGGLKIDGSVPQIIYAGTTIGNMKLHVRSGVNAIDYAVHIGEVSSAAFEINNIALNGKAMNDQMSLTLSIKDRKGVDHYKLKGVLTAEADQFQFSFNPDSLLLNYQTWTISADNILQFGPAGVMAGNFNLTGNGQGILVNSNPQQGNAPLLVEFSSFKIATLAAIVGGEKLIADGTINGSINLSSLESSPVFVGDLTITGFTFMDNPVGNIALEINNTTPDTYAAIITITGERNNMVVYGEYFVKPDNKSNFDFDLDIRNLNLASMESFTMGYLKYTTGNIRGKLNIKGTAETPSIRGDLRFDKAGFNIAMLNSYYSVVDEQIRFTDQGIGLSSFTLVDTLGNKLIVDGTIFTNNYMDYRFGLNVKSNNFKVLSSTSKDNKLFYGDVFMNSNLRIGGTMGSPVVEGSVRINEGTDFSIVIPQNAPGVVERDGVVEFVDMDDPESIKVLSSGLDSLNTSTITGLDVSVNVEVDSSAVFNIIIDEGSGDFLKLQGEAQLTAGIDPGGNVTLTGVYEVTQGAYELSFNFIRRRFIIEKGSIITWQGEPTTAEVNITAVYVANTAPYDLVESKLNETPAALNRYKQKLPFNVLLNMKGELMKPQLTFDIVLPNRNYNVASDVVDNVQYQLTQLRTQSSELNKQVFALLLLNRFVAENPFASGAGGGGVESLARSSVSKLLSEQLNNLAGSLITGVDLNFDLVSSEDYTSGQLENRTDLNVGLSKELLNDRLKVSIGSNFELEGPKNTNHKATNIAGNMALDYQLSRDGRYMLRAYRKNEYVGVAEGYLIETGLGFIFTFDYELFRNLFIKKEEEIKIP